MDARRAVRRRCPRSATSAEPKLAFFFDEAHLLFDDASEALLDQIERTARLIRSKGVGRLLRDPGADRRPVVRAEPARQPRPARAPRVHADDADALRKTARTFPITEHYDVEEALTSLGIGEALVTVLSPDGVPTPARRTRLVPPDSRMAPADEAVLTDLVAGSPLRVKYLAAPDRRSAHDILGERLASADAVAATPPPPKRRERSVFGTLHVPRR